MYHFSKLEKKRSTLSHCCKFGFIFDNEFIMRFKIALKLDMLFVIMGTINKKGLERLLTW